jgi:hypothetical protein
MEDPIIRVTGNGIVEVRPTRLVPLHSIPYMQEFT